MRYPNAEESNRMRLEAMEGEVFADIREGKDLYRATPDASSSFADMLNSRGDVSDPSVDPDPEATAYLRRTRGY
jgi:hypothetical protein